MFSPVRSAGNRSMSVSGVTRTDGNSTSPRRHSSTRTGSRPELVAVEREHRLGVERVHDDMVEPDDFHCRRLDRPGLEPSGPGSRLGTCALGAGTTYGQGPGDRSGGRTDGRGRDRGAHPGGVCADPPRRRIAPRPHARSGRQRRRRRGRVGRPAPRRPPAGAGRQRRRLSAAHRRQSGHRPATAIRDRAPPRIAVRDVGGPPEIPAIRSSAARHSPTRSISSPPANARCSYCVTTRTSPRPRSPSS